MVPQADHSGAVFDSERRYRYRLTRRWEQNQPLLAWIMLNPSTAGEDQDDPTIRRCQGFAADWGYGGIVVGNLFALRTANPEDLKEHPDPIGPKNDRYLRQIIEAAETVVVAWGIALAETHIGTSRRERVVNLIKMEGETLWALDTTLDGQPVHPLYKPADIKLERYDNSDSV